ncbi:hypothetical protein HDU76_001997 [Blyttiomyces sp. JEL0837]|nr:hypothetical protein HDU76_001997 [Blyttiomyces sp. JEL0837]
MQYKHSHPAHHVSFAQHSDPHTHNNNPSRTTKSKHTKPEQPPPHHQRPPRNPSATSAFSYLPSSTSILPLPRTDSGFQSGSTSPKRYDGSVGVGNGYSTNEGDEDSDEVTVRGDLYEDETEHQHHPPQSQPKPPTRFGLLSLLFSKSRDKSRTIRRTSSSPDSNIQHEPSSGHNRCLSTASHTPLHYLVKDSMVESTATFPPAWSRSNRDLMKGGEGDGRRGVRYPWDCEKGVVRDVVKGDFCGGRESVSSVTGGSTVIGDGDGDGGSFGGRGSVTSGGGGGRVEAGFNIGGVNSSLGGIDLDSDTLEVVDGSRKVDGFNSSLMMAMRVPNGRPVGPRPIPEHMRDQHRVRRLQHDFGIYRGGGGGVGGVGMVMDENLPCWARCI